MNKKILSQAMGNISEKYILEALAADSRAQLAERGKKAGSLRRTGRTLLIAAVLILALAVAATAVYQYTLKDAVMELPESVRQESTSAPAGSAGEDEADNERLFRAGTYGDGREMYYYSMAGYDKESPEYKAQQEWLYYYFEDESGKVYDEREFLSRFDPHQCYGVGYQNKADKLDEIARRYGLSLAQANYYVDRNNGNTLADTYDILGTEPFILSDFDIHSGLIYDEGSFMVNGDLTCPGGTEPVSVNFYCAMDGTLPVFDIRGEDPNSLICKSVTLGDITADLALGEHNSMIFVTLKNCHVLVSVLGGKGERYNAAQAIDMAALEAIAACFDYGKVDKFDRAQRTEKVAGLFEQQTEQVYRGVSDRAVKAQEIYDELGGFAITALPEDYSFGSLFTTSVEESAEISTVGCFINVRIGYMKAGDENEERTITLGYGRYWANSEQTEQNNRLGFKRPSTECTVNGCEARYREVREAGIWPWTNELQWLDADRELLFSVSVPSDYTMEQAIALAESVAEAE